MTSFFIYSFDLFVVLSPDWNTGLSSVVANQSLVHDLSSLRGSAAPSPFQNGFLALAHEVVVKNDDTKCYIHSFIYLDKECPIEKISKRFVFFYVGAEFCCSMSCNHEKNILSLGLRIVKQDFLLLQPPL